MVRQPPLRIRSVESRAKAPPAIEDRFTKLSAQFEELKAQVRQAQQLSALGTAAATIAHEVNNLLTPILSYADYALQCDDLQLAKKALTVTARNTRMLIAMSERILELGAAKPSKREPVAVGQAVEEALASLCRDLAKDGITFEANIHESLTVYADPLQLRQALFNLFLNAREAMAANHSGRLSVSAYRSREQRRTDDPSRDREQADGGEVRSEKLEDRSSGNSNGNRQSAIDNVVIEIRNTGRPIPRDLLPHIFEPFQTGKPMQHEGKSRCNGLGLALVRDLIEENDGTISVACDDTGTTFTIALPACQA